MVVTVPVFDGGDYRVTATVTDGAGNTSPVSEPQTFTFEMPDTEAPGALQIAIPEAQPDTLVDETEVLDGVQVHELPEDAAIGDVMTLTVVQPDGSDTVITVRCQIIGTAQMTLLLLSQRSMMGIIQSPRR